MKILNKFNHGYMYNTITKYIFIYIRTQIFYTSLYFLKKKNHQCTFCVFHTLDFSTVYMLFMKPNIKSFSFLNNYSVKYIYSSFTFIFTCCDPSILFKQPKVGTKIEFVLINCITEYGIILIYTIHFVHSHVVLTQCQNTLN